MSARSGYKAMWQAAEAKASELEKALDEMTRQMKEWRKEAQREQARAGRMAKLLNDGTEADELRLQLAEARAELMSMELQAKWGCQEADGQEKQCGQQAEIDGHDIAYWHKQALDLKEAYWKRTEQTNELSKALENARQEKPAKATIQQAMIDGHDIEYWHRQALASKASTPKHAGGRPRVYNEATRQKVQDLRKQGASIRAIAGQVGISTATVQSWLKGSSI